MHLKENAIYYGRSTLVPRYAAGLGIIPFSRVLAACGGNLGKTFQISADKKETAIDKPKK